MVDVEFDENVVKYDDVFDVRGENLYDGICNNIGRGVVKDSFLVVVGVDGGSI